MISACRGKFDRFGQIEQLDYEYDVLKFRDKQEFSNATVARSPANNPINNGNCTEWRAIWSEIKRVITKSHDRVAGVRFVITSLISDQNCPTRSAITTLLYSF